MPILPGNPGSTSKLNGKKTIRKKGTTSCKIDFVTNITFKFYKKFFLDQKRNNGFVNVSHSSFQIIEQANEKCTVFYSLNWKMIKMKKQILI